MQVSDGNINIYIHTYIHTYIHKLDYIGTFVGLGLESLQEAGCHKT